MTRRRTISRRVCGWALLAVAGTVLVVLGAAGEEPRVLPNIVIVLADDLGYGDPQCYDEASKIPTPHLDALASQGVRFLDAHAPASVCTPTRYSLLTGRYAWRTRMKSGVLWTNDRLLIEPGRETIASLLQRHGYETACIGKWHLGLGAYDPKNPDGKSDHCETVDAGPHTVGFAYSLIIPASLDIPPYLYLENGKPTQPVTAHAQASARRWSGGGGFWREGRMAEGFDHEQVLPSIVERSVRTIRDHAAAGSGRPLLLYVPLTAPHTPWMPTTPFRGRSKAGWYGDFVAQVDDAVGQITKALDEAGLARNTLLLVTSDNGSHWRPADIHEFGHRANGIWRGQKADIHEGGHRVPLIVRWPAVVAPRSTSSTLVGLNDVYATVAAIVGEAKRPAVAEDSVSFLPALRGRPEAARETLVLHSIDGLFSIRRGAWKLVDGLGSGGFTKPKRREPEPGGVRGQLYDLAADPGESRNLYGERPDLVAELGALLAWERARATPSPEDAKEAE